MKLINILKASQQSIGALAYVTVTNNNTVKQQ